MVVNCEVSYLDIQLHKYPLLSLHPFDTFFPCEGCFHLLLHSPFAQQQECCLGAKHRILSFLEKAVTNFGPVEADDRNFDSEQIMSFQPTGCPTWSSIVTKSNKRKQIYFPKFVEFVYYFYIPLSKMKPLCCSGVLTRKLPVGSPQALLKTIGPILVAKTVPLSKGIIAI
jgi:hypothetical protein